MNEPGYDPEEQDRRAPLSLAALLPRLALIGAVMGGLALVFAGTAGWLTPGRLTAPRFIDAFERVNGPHPGFRRNHAKGVCVTGFFESNGAGAVLSKAVVFKPGRVPVVGRFALAGGMPYAADMPDAVRSMALQFQLPDGEEWRTGLNDIPVFVVNTPRGFYDQLIASRPDPATGKPDPARMKDFLAKHPETARAKALIRQHPFSSGFDNSTYNSLDAFVFIGQDGARRAVRWAMVPVRPYAPETKAAGDRNYLFDALTGLLKQGPLQWHLVATLAAPGDVTSDATIPWPDDRRKVDLGLLTLTAAEDEAAGPCRDINYDPLVLPAGIAPSDDPLLSARSAAYARSATRRAGEIESRSPQKDPVPVEGGDAP